MGGVTGSCHMAQTLYVGIVSFSFVFVSMG